MAPETDERGVREFSIVRYLYKVYYWVERDEVWILHIRHTARRPWTEEADET
jgi:plasmid stabilization system protein ParE